MLNPRMRSVKAARDRGVETAAAVTVCRPFLGRCPPEFLRLKALDALYETSLPPPRP
jgi:hypothetical protein